MELKRTVWHWWRDALFLKPTMKPSKVLFCPQLKDIQFHVTAEERNQKTFTFKETESENFNFI